MSNGVHKKQNLNRYLKISNNANYILAETDWSYSQAFGLIR